MDFSNQVVVVTGAGSGIGRATAIAFAGRGARLVLVDIDDDNGEETLAAIKADGGAAIFVHADVSVSRDVQRYVAGAIDSYGTIDCFFNNAGIEGIISPIHEYDEAAFDKLMAINVRGVFLGLRYVLPIMISRQRGAIVNTSSVAGQLAAPGTSAYVASKHAVIGLTKTAAGEVARLGVRVNAVCPGPIDTRMMDSIVKMRNPNDTETAAARFRSGIPRGRFGSAEEIANVVLFLCSDLAANVTGAQIYADGGRTAVGSPVAN